MQLKMYVGGAFISAIKFNKVNLSKPDYLLYLQYELVQRNEDLLAYCTEEPEFILEGMSSQLNAFSSLLDEVIKSVDQQNKHKE